MTKPQRRTFVRIMRAVAARLAADPSLLTEIRNLIGEDFSETCHLHSEAESQGAEEQNGEVHPPAISPSIEDDHRDAEIDSDVSHVESTRSTVPVSDVSAQPTESGDLALISQRSRVKAAASRLASERIRLISSGVAYSSEIEPRDRQIIETAKKLSNCYLWMIRPTVAVPSDLSVYETLAICFDLLAEVLELAAVHLEIISSDRQLHAELLQLAAEAQSALRQAVQQFGDFNDNDQLESFFWVRNSATAERLFVGRFMRKDDHADPAQSSELLFRINAFSARVKLRAQSNRKRKKLFQKLRYQLEEASADGQHHHWESVADTVEELIEMGTPPSNLDLRASLLPHFEIIRHLDYERQGFQLVLREMGRFRAARFDEPIRDDSPQLPSFVHSVAELIQGQAVVLIGGDARPDAKEALEQAFGLSELIWVPSKHGQSVRTFEPFIARSDVVVVLLAIRWASHSFTDIQHFCRDHNKPFVRLPAGYSPNQVAIQIMNQCSLRLGGTIP